MECRIAGVQPNPDVTVLKIFDDEVDDDNDYKYNNEHRDRV